VDFGGAPVDVLHQAGILYVPIRKKGGYPEFPLGHHRLVEILRNLPHWEKFKFLMTKMGCVGLLNLRRGVRVCVYVWVGGGEGSHPKYPLGQHCLRN
jgi:hypothetical protein